LHADQPRICELEKRIQCPRTACSVLGPFNAFDSVCQVLDPIWATSQ
jgi:hypothetical protein